MSGYIPEKVDRGLMEKRGISSSQKEKQESTWIELKMFDGTQMNRICNFNMPFQEACTKMIISNSKHNRFNMLIVVHKGIWLNESSIKA